MTKYNIKSLEDKLKSLGILGRIVKVIVGPEATQYQFEPEAETSMSDILNSESDINRTLKTNNVTVGEKDGFVEIDIPNQNAQKIELNTLLNSSDFANSGYKIPVVLGVDVAGNPMYYDLQKMPHMLIAGRTGSGKSVFMQSIITSIMYRFTPDRCKLMIIDPKGVDYGFFDDVPHLIRPIVKLDQDDFVNALKWAVREMNDRYKKIKNNDNNQMPYLVVVIDEVADLISDKNTMENIIKITQKGRAVGVHLVLGTQHINKEILSDEFVANFPVRCVFKVRNSKESELALGESGAQYLLEHGDMLFSDAGREPVRIHTPFISYPDYKA